MKDYRKANLGRPFEELLTFANDRYADRGEAIVVKVPTAFIPLRDRTGKVYSVKVEQKSITDYMGRYRQSPIAIEAKHTSTDSIRWDAVQPHQAAFLDKFTAQPGTIGLVVVSFNMRRFFALPWTHWKAAYDERVHKAAKSTPVTCSAFGVKWDIPKKFSVRADEIPPEFEVQDYVFPYGLHYLRDAEKYITAGNS